MLITLKTLLILAQIYSNLPVPVSGSARNTYNNMTVTFLPKEMMEEAVCGGRGRCDGNNIAAYKIGSRSIIAGDACEDYKHNIACQGVLLHEMVHFLQYLNGKYTVIQKGPFDQTEYCTRYINNEREAYDAQRRYLLDKKFTVNWTVDSALTGYSCIIQ